MLLTVFETKLIVSLAVPIGLVTVLVTVLKEKLTKSVARPRTLEGGAEAGVEVGVGRDSMGSGSSVLSEMVLSRMMLKSFRLFCPETTLNLFLVSSGGM